MTAATPTPEQRQASRMIRGAKRRIAARYDGPLEGRHLWRLIRRVAAEPITRNPEEREELAAELALVAARYLKENPGPYRASDERALADKLRGATNAALCNFRRARGYELPDPDDLTAQLERAEQVAARGAERAERRGINAPSYHPAADNPAADPLPPHLEALRDWAGPNILAAIESTLSPLVTSDEWATAEQVSPGAWRKRAERGRKELAAEPERLSTIGTALVGLDGPRAPEPGDDFRRYRATRRGVGRIAAEPPSPGRTARLRAAVALLCAAVAGARRAKVNPARNGATGPHGAANLPDNGWRAEPAPGEVGTVDTRAAEPGSLGPIIPHPRHTGPLPERVGRVNTGDGGATALAEPLPVPPLPGHDRDGFGLGDNPAIAAGAERVAAILARAEQRRRAGEQVSR